MAVQRLPQRAPLRAEDSGFSASALLPPAGTAGHLTDAAERPLVTDKGTAGREEDACPCTLLFV